MDHVFFSLFEELKKYIITPWEKKIERKNALVQNSWNKLCYYTKWLNYTWPLKKMVWNIKISKKGGWWSWSTLEKPWETWSRQHLFSNNMVKICHFCPKIQERVVYVPILNPSGPQISAQSSTWIWTPTLTLHTVTPSWLPGLHPRPPVVRRVFSVWKTTKTGFVPKKKGVEMAQGCVWSFSLNNGKKGQGCYNKSRTNYMVRKALSGTDIVFPKNASHIRYWPSSRSGRIEGLRNGRTSVCVRPQPLFTVNNSVQQLDLDASRRGKNESCSGTHRSRQGGRKTYLHTWLRIWATTTEGGREKITARR